MVRGVDPIKQFFISVYQKKTQYDAFNSKSGDRVGYIAKDSEVPGTRLTCHRRAIASRPAMNSTNEFSCDWKAPTIPPGQGVESTGVVVVKVTLTRDPLSIGPDEQDPGLVHLSYTLKEVAPPKKGSVLSEMSQKVEKEEKKYDVDVVAMHQLFIDFLRNQASDTVHPSIRVLGSSLDPNPRIALVPHTGSSLASPRAPPLLHHLLRLSPGPRFGRNHALAQVLPDNGRREVCGAVVRDGHHV